jgi:hypothetical protein
VEEVHERSISEALTVVADRLVGGGGGSGSRVLTFWGLLGLLSSPSPLNADTRYVYVVDALSAKSEKLVVGDRPTSVLSR